MWKSQILFNKDVKSGYFQSIENSLLLTVTWLILPAINYHTSTDRYQAQHWCGKAKCEYAFNIDSAVFPFVSAHVNDGKCQFHIPWPLTVALMFIFILLRDRALKESQGAFTVFMIISYAALSFKPKGPYPVNNPCRVKMLDSTEHLVQKVRHSLMVQLHLNDLAQVGIH